MLREPSRDFYIRAETQEIPMVVVTPATVSAGAGRLSHDATNDPVAGCPTAGAGTGAGPAGAAAGCDPAPPVHTGDRAGAWSGRSGAGGDQLQSVASAVPWPRLPEGLQPIGGDALPRHPAQRLLESGRSGRVRPARLADERGPARPPTYRADRRDEGARLARVPHSR